MNTEAVTQNDTAQLMTAGAMTLPANSDAARANVILVLDAAKKLGIEYPGGGGFYAGQVFFGESGPVEVRLAVVLPAELQSSNDEIEIWTTEKPPEIQYQDGQLRYNSDPQNRAHLSAAMNVTTEGAEMGLIFDFRGTDMGIAGANYILSDEPSRTPEEVSESLARLPNGKADRDISRALMHYPNWPLNENLMLRYYDGSEGNIVSYQPSEVEQAMGDAPERALDALDRSFNKLKSEAVADIIDILFHHWNTHKDTKTGAVPIDAAKLCEYRGKVPEGDNLRIHWEALRDAFSMRLHDTKSDINAKIFDFDSRGETKDGPSARYFYRPGIFLEYAMRGEQLYFTPFLQKVWALDPKHHNEAKRLVRYLRGDWRMNTEKYLEAETGKARPTRWRSWAMILTECGIDVESYRKKPNGKPYHDGPRRLMGKMERAVETLWDMEVIDDSAFGIYHPDDRQTAENLPRRGALDKWLTLRVCLAPSAKLREALLETDKKRRAGRARDANALATAKAKKQLRAEEKSARNRG